jgi:uncharacterized protein (UPF0248 family)
VLSRHRKDENKIKSPSCEEIIWALDFPYAIWKIRIWHKLSLSEVRMLRMRMISDIMRKIYFLWNNELP